MRKKWQCSGRVNWPYGFQGTLPKVGMDSAKVLLPVFSGNLFLGKKMSEMEEAEKYPNH